MLLKTDQNYAISLMAVEIKKERLDSRFDLIGVFSILRIIFWWFPEVSGFHGVYELANKKH